MLKLIPCLACLVSLLFLSSPSAQRDLSALKIHYVPSDMRKNIAQYEKEFREIFWKK